ncbi:hypothetical protein PV326_008095 [Microctonus aethiopoides]|nr:hypothetical protein PV326_008095 [Microctonus aethiopoides]
MRSKLSRDCICTREDKTIANATEIDAKTEPTWDRLRSTSPETPPAKITRLTSPLSLSSSVPLSLGAKTRNIAKQTTPTIMDGMDNKPALNDDPSVTLTIRLIMQGKVLFDNNTKLPKAQAFVVVKFMIKDQNQMSSQ